METQAHTVHITYLAGVDPLESAPGEDDTTAERNAAALGPTLSAGPSSALSSEPSDNISHGHPVPARHDSTGSGAWSTAATPGVRDEDESRDGLAGINTGESETKAAPVRPSGDHDEKVSRRDSNADKKNVRFAGPDGVPLSPAATFVSMDSYVAPLGPPPTILSDDDDGNRATSPASVASKPIGRQFKSNDVDSDGPSAPLKTLFVDKTPSAPLPSPEAVATAPAPVQLDSKAIERCQKHCKWAISALDYEDLETARAELRKALEMLG